MRGRINGRLKLFTLLFLAALLIYQSQIVTAALSQQAQQGPPASPSLVRGITLWFENCAPCHGTTGQGDGPTAAALEYPSANFADPIAARTRTLAGMFDVALNGRMERMMPPWGGQLTEQEIWDAVAYAQNLSVDMADLEAGAAIFATSCASCHGEDGIADENDLSDLNDLIDLTQPALLVDTSQQTLFETLRADDVHAPLADLPDEAWWQSLDFVRTLSVELPALNGQLQGGIRNGTTGDLVANTPVTLHALSPDGDILQTYTTTSDVDGGFTFTKLNEYK